MRPGCGTASKKTEQLKQKSASASPMEKLPALLVNVCRQVIQATNNEWITLSTLGQALKQHDPKCKSRSYGYKSLTNLVTA